MTHQEQRKGGHILWPGAGERGYSCIVGCVCFQPRRREKVLHRPSSEHNRETRGHRTSGQVGGSHPQGGIPQSWCSQHLENVHDQASPLLSTDDGR